MGTAVFGAPEFRARSGRTVRANEDGSVTFQGVRGYLGPEQVFDAEEFFQARRDAELGRWRDPVAPAVVATMRPDGLFVFDEVALEYSVFQRPLYGGHAVRTSTGDYGLGGTADRFFEAHPERKPWEDAAVGDIWVLGFELGTSSAWVRGDGFWHLPDNPEAKLHLAFSVISGRRIWPEDAS